MREFFLFNTLFKYVSFGIIFLFSSHILFSFFFGFNHELGLSFDYTRIITFILFSSLIIFLTFKIDSKSINRVFNHKFLLCILLIPLFQSFFSSHINTSLVKTDQVIYSISYILISLVIILGASHFNIKVEKRRFFSTIIILNFIVFIPIILFFLFFHDLLTLKEVINRFFFNIRLLNHLQTIFLPILFFLFIIIKNKKLKLLLLFLFSINMFFLFFTGARGSTISLLFSSFLIFLFSNKKIKKQVVLFILLFILNYLICMLFDNFFIFEASHSKHLLSTTYPGRLEIWNTILPHIIEIQYFFHAPGFSSPLITQLGFFSPHNLFLFAFLGGGTIFIILFIFYIIKIFYNFLFIKISILNTYLLFTLFSIFTHSMVSGLYFSILATPLIIYIFIFFYSNFKSRKISTLKNTIFITYIFKIIIGIFLIIYWINILKSYQYSFTNQYFLKEIKSQEVKIYIIPGIFMYIEKVKQLDKK